MKIFRRRGASQDRDRTEQAIQEYRTAYERGLAAEQSQGPAQALAEFARAQHALDRLEAASADLPEVPQARAGLLYAMGRTRTDVGDVTGAVAALDQAEELYERMESEQLATRKEGEQRGEREETGPVPAVLLTADVRLRRAQAYAEWDRPFSALSDLDMSIGGYMRAGAFAPLSDRSGDAARILAVGAGIQLRVGDHELALECGQEALARYQEMGRIGPEAIPYAIGSAAPVVSTLEAARGQWDAALAVDNMILEAAELGRVGSSGAHARIGVHLREAGRDAEAAGHLAMAARGSHDRIAEMEREFGSVLAPSLREALLEAERTESTRLAGGVRAGALDPLEIRTLRLSLCGGDGARFSTTGRMNVVNAVPRQVTSLARIGHHLITSDRLPAALRVLWEALLLCDAARRWTTLNPGDSTATVPLREAEEGALAGAAVLVDMLERAGDPMSDALTADLINARERLGLSAH
ncbi:hypothetical protein ACFVY7_12935 [[Kitasatospora] papulosa]|uniref:hypothetical protein n=1 Tax=Streptomyces TaxID=1883 RepID=UPI0023AEB2AF|nr:hypothetical protein [Streptomyces sp. KA12]MDF0374366.1 hypothetical protein [Streptomyces sp. KA12]